MSTNHMTRPRAKKRVLFVCTENRVRSATAEQVYRGRPDLEVRSAGVAEYAAVPLTPELFNWADLVFVFSKRQQRIVEARFPDRAQRKRLVCLGLPDRFEYKSPKLVTKLTVKLRPYLGAPAKSRESAAGAGDHSSGSAARKMLNLVASLLLGDTPPSATTNDSWADRSQPFLSS
jgi:predicted protein tyrosine phosphatase